jgi:hypothetical protein
LGANASAPWGGLNDEKPNRKFNRIKERNKGAIKFNECIKPENLKLQNGEKGTQ